jgi:hypothetical protein
LISLKIKLDELTKNFQTLIKNKDPKNGADVLESLISLQSKIINKKNMIDQKSNKIESKTQIFLYLIIKKIYSKQEILINSQNLLKSTMKLE